MAASSLSAKHGINLGCASIIVRMTLMLWPKCIGVYRMYWSIVWLFATADMSGSDQFSQDSGSSQL